MCFIDGDENTGNRILKYVLLLISSLMVDVFGNIARSKHHFFGGCPMPEIVALPRMSVIGLGSNVLGNLSGHVAASRLYV